MASLVVGKTPVVPAAEIRTVPEVLAPCNVSPVGEWAPEMESLVSEALVCRLGGRSPVAQLAL